MEEWEVASLRIRSWAHFSSVVFPAVSLWSGVSVSLHVPSQCGLDTATDSQLDEVKRTFLTSGSVKPVGGGPIVVSSGQRYSHVTAMRTQAANGRQYTVLFLLTGEASHCRMFTV